ncbi:hypothetical protein GRI75_01445 [Altererythrobacter soli]|uniref:Uncharacterized protein n=1 Tax=Croceibacterium soli TaxID=1739690 RepID=A0A6I4URZ8_9SPHN|nr:hypothetical protein [Croceibacterium soli]MXP40307.1 hypothetical protein [Croceibacterium soli]
MIGKIIGAIAGAKVAQHSRNVGGTGGALLGAAAVPLIRRMSLPAMLVLGAGGYAYKKWSDRREAEQAKRKSFETPPKAASAGA